MLTQKKYDEVCAKALNFLDTHGIVLTSQEKEQLEVADFGLGEIEKTGVQIIVYVNTERVCAKELIMLPGQTCPEHMHPTINGIPGKEETFRCRAGMVYLYVPGEAAINPACTPPAAPDGAYTVWHEIKLVPGEQYTLYPDTLHWFQAGPQGAIVSEFSTKNSDDMDVFSDKRIIRTPEICG